MKMKNHIVSFVVLILLSLPIIWPFFKEGYFVSHDGEWAVVRLADMYRTVVTDHQIPARYSGYLNAGYGYPLFNFAYPAPYYLGLIPLILNSGFVGSIKLLFAVSVPLSALCMYLLSYTLWKNKWAGIVSALLYVYAPYRMVDLFVRGSIGESISFVIFPLLIYLSLLISDKQKSVWPILFFSFSFALLITTHNIMTVLFTPILLIIIGLLVMKKNKQSGTSFAYALGLGLGLSAFFWLPALSEKNFIWLSQIPIADRNLYFVSLERAILPSWGYAPPTEPNGFSYQIGIVQIAVLALSVLFSVSYIRVKKRTFQQTMVIVLTAILLGAIAMMFRFTRIVWEITPLIKEINYPWIMLSQIIFLVALLGGFFAGQKKLYMYISGILVALSIVFTLSYAKPQEYVNRGDEFYVTNDAVTTSSDEYLPLWTRSKPPHRPDQKVEIEGAGTLENIAYSSQSVSFTATVQDTSQITVNTIYYPGWKFFVDSESVIPLYDNEYGVMQISLTPGTHEVHGLFTRTPLRTISDNISLLSLIAALLLLFIKPLQQKIGVIPPK